MLIEWRKLDFRQKQNKLSRLYIVALVDWDRENDLPQREVELIRCASIQKPIPGVPTTIVLRKGECIPNTSTRSQADNYGIRFSDLKTDWSKVLRYVLNNLPPDLSEYPNLYTGRLLVRAHEVKEAIKVLAPSVDQAEAISKECPTAIVRWLKKLFGFEG